MAFFDCIISKASKGLLSEKQAKETTDLYEKLFRRYQNTMGDDAAAHAAANQAQNLLSQRLIKENQNNVRAASFQSRVTKDLQGRVAEKKIAFDKLSRVQKALIGKPTFLHETAAMLERVFDNVQSVRRLAFSNINEFIKAHGTKWAGLVQDHEGVQNVVREVLGEKTGNASAALFGNKIRQTFNMLHGMYEDAGGIIGKIENYFPQTHRADLVAAAPMEEWRAFHKGLLDTSKMIDLETGLPLDAAKLDQLMAQDYKSITTHGLSDIAADVAAGKKTVGFGSDVAKRHDSGRFYHYKDADSFLAYNRKYGYGDNGLFEAVIGHIQVMARDIGIMQKMGPKANSLMRHLDLHIGAEGAGKTKRNWVNGMYDVLGGRLAGDGDQPMWYKVLEGTKDILRAALLGGAPVSALTDATNVALAARMNGLDATKTLKHYIGHINPADGAARRIAERNGFISESMLGISFSTARYADDASGPQWTRAAAGFVNSASGLQAMTEAAKNAPALELQAALAEAKLSGKGYADMPKIFRDAMKERGITKEQFATWMKSDLFQHPERPGVNFLRPEEIAEHDLDAAMALDGWQNRLRFMAANEPSLATRAITTGAAFGDARVGTVTRAFVSSLLMFKSFPITMMINQLLPAIREAAQGRAGNLATLAIGMSVLGGVAVQTKSLLAGKDAMDMKNAAFWRAALLQGGGLGLFGDFMFTDYNRFGNDLVTSLAGPVAGLGDDIWKLSKGKLDAAFDNSTLDGKEKDINFRRDLVKVAARYTPALNLWYGRLFVERELIDSSQRMVDPNFNRRMRQIEQQTRQNTGQGFWWAHGDTLPKRAPQVGVPPRH